jgi:hypothetical protein
MNIKLLIAVASLCLAVAANADEAAAIPLDRDEIIELVSEKTTECRKEKDGSLCSNYFSEDGVIKRVMHDDDARRDGRWFIDDEERLCILWDGKIKPLCFAVFEQDDGSFNLIRREKHITTITGVEDGNTRGL